MIAVVRETEDDLQTGDLRVPVTEDINTIQMTWIRKIDIRSGKTVWVMSRLEKS